VAPPPLLTVRNGAMRVRRRKLQRGRENSGGREALRVYLLIVAGGLNEGDAEIRGEGTSWNLGEAAARGLDGKGTGVF